MDRRQGAPDGLEPLLVGIGFTTGDLGLPLILIATAARRLAARRAGRVQGGGGSAGSAVLASLLLIAYLVTVWAMTTKPV